MPMKRSASEVHLALSGGPPLSPGNTLIYRTKMQVSSNPTRAYSRRNIGSIKLKPLGVSRSRTDSKNLVSRTSHLSDSFLVPTPVSDLNTNPIKNKAYRSIRRVASLPPLDIWSKPCPLKETQATQKPARTWTGQKQPDPKINKKTFHSQKHIDPSTYYFRQKTSKIPMNAQSQTKDSSIVLGTSRGDAEKSRYRMGRRGCIPRRTTSNLDWREFTINREDITTQALYLQPKNITSLSCSTRQSTATYTPTNNEYSYENFTEVSDDVFLDHLQNVKITSKVNVNSPHQRLISSVSTPRSDIIISSARSKPRQLAPLNRVSIGEDAFSDFYITSCSRRNSSGFHGDSSKCHQLLNSRRFSLAANDTGNQDHCRMSSSISVCCSRNGRYVPKPTTELLNKKFSSQNHNNWNACRFGSFNDKGVNNKKGIHTDGKVTVNLENSSQFATKRNASSHISCGSSDYETVDENNVQSFTRCPLGPIREGLVECSEDIDNSQTTDESKLPKDFIAFENTSKNGAIRLISVGSLTTDCSKMAKNTDACINTNTDDSNPESTKSSRSKSSISIASTPVPQDSRGPSRPLSSASSLEETSIYLENDEIASLPGSPFPKPGQFRRRSSSLDSGFSRPGSDLLEVPAASANTKDRMPTTLVDSPTDSVSRSPTPSTSGLNDEIPLSSQVVHIFSNDFFIPATPCQSPVEEPCGSIPLPGLNLPQKGTEVQKTSSPDAPSVSLTTETGDDFAVWFGRRGSIYVEEKEEADELIHVTTTDEKGQTSLGVPHIRPK